MQDNFADKNQVVMKVISYHLAKKIIVENHYSHTMPACQLALGFYINERLNCVIIFGPSATAQMVNSLPSENYWELTRLFSFDWGGKHIESICIAKALKYAERVYKKDVIISFADPSQGHSGCIYQATNWLYCGHTGTTGGWQYYFDGKWQHPRSTVAKYGTRERNKIVKLFPNIKARRVPKKHRYIYLLGNKKKRRELRKRLKYLVLPYPKLIEPDDYNKKVNAILNKEYCTNVDKAIKLSSSDFADLIV